MSHYTNAVKDYAVVTTKTETRGRKRRFDLDTALAEAQQRFHAGGYEGAKLAEICAALGITQTSLYAAYGSKIGLFEKVVARYAETTASFVGDALAEADTPAEVWSGVLGRAAATYGRTDAPGCLVLGTDVATTDPQARAILTDQVRRTEAAIGARLEDLCAADPAAEARAIMTLLRGLSGAARAGAGSEELQGVVGQLLPVG
jgi:TetR/AcrR family transcriptional repressor for divergent bdcA